MYKIIHYISITEHKISQVAGLIDYYRPFETAGKLTKTGSLFVFLIAIAVFNEHYSYFVLGS